MCLWRTLKVVQGRRKVFLFKRVNLWEASTAVSTGNDKEIGESGQKAASKGYKDLKGYPGWGYSPPSALFFCPGDPKVGTHWGKPHVCLVFFPPDFHRINQIITHTPSYLVWEKGTKGTRGVPGMAKRNVRKVRVCMADSVHVSLFTFLATEGGEAASFSCGTSPSRSSGSQVAWRGSLQASGVAHSHGSAFLKPA